jgi:hypothetical protein
VVIDVCLFFLWARRLLCNVFPFPVCKAQLIGDWYENRRGAPNTIIFLVFRQYYWRTDAPCANWSGGPKKKKKLLAHCVWPALPVGGEGHWCANILADRCPPRHHYWLTEHKKCTEMLGFCVCKIKRIKRGGPNSSVRFAYFQANHLLI